MKGDFTRVTFDPAKQYTRVLMQQGRVQLDADWNEQADILLHYLRTLAADLIGPFGAPAEKDGTPGQGFKLALRRNPDGTPVDNDFVVLPGRYYVDGIAAENPQEWIYSATPGHPLPGPLEKGPRYLLYLDVWERHILHLQDELLREVALLGPDTATRSKVVWRVRATKQTPDKQPIPDDLTCQSIRREWSRWVQQWQAAQRGRLKARAKPGKPDDTDPCLASPEARYRGENQLYRVEIHGGASGAGGTATYKWSADNGSVVFAVREPAKAGGKTTVTLEHLGRDDRSDLVQDDWVEVVDGEEDLRDGTSPLLKVESVDRDRRQVILKGEPPPDLGKDPSKPLMLRRWDHRRGIGRRKPTAAGVYPVVEGEWLDLEDGVQIFFAPPEGGGAHIYRPGDYWLIPARVATGDVEWPGPPDNPLPLPPHGVQNHFAPLGLLTLRTDGKVETTDCRTLFGTRSSRLDTGLADWQLVAEPSGLGRPILPRSADLVVPINSAWGSISGARWISSSRDAGTVDQAAGDYIFELRFNLSSCFHDAGISLDLLADNGATVSLNGHLLGERPGPEGFKEPPTHIETDDQTLFVAGKNVLSVVLHNEGGPTGFILRGAVDADGGLCR